MYARSMAEARGLTTTTTTPGSTMQRGCADVVGELCDKLMASTLRKTIGRSKVELHSKAAFHDVKLNLDGQFDECLEVSVYFPTKLV